MAGIGGSSIGEQSIGAGQVIEPRSVAAMRGSFEVTKELGGRFFITPVFRGIMELTKVFRGSV